MNYFKLSILSAAMLELALLAGCGAESVANTMHLAEPPGAHADHETQSETRTHFGARSELFVEFPRLVLGQPSTFAAHLTWLADFKPLRQGRLSVQLSGPNGAAEEFLATEPAVPGIFKPVVTPTVAGTRDLTLVFETADGVLRHELGQVQVFADAHAARAYPGAAESEGAGIAFSKERQWKIDFATAQAVAGIARDSVRATGTIRATPDGEALLAAPTAGILRAADNFPRVGQRVRKGQILAYLVPRLGGDTDQATLEAGAGKARIAFEQSRRERERMELLYENEAVAEKRLLDARAKERIAAAERAAAERRLAQLSGGGGIALRAAIDGVIAEVPVAAGAYVAEGAPVLHIANTGKLWLEARVPESKVGRLGTPTGASFMVDGFERSFVIEPGRNGRLIAIGGVVDAATRTVPVIFEFANPERSLRLGLSARVQIFTGSGSDSLLVPAGAVQDESGTQVVYVQTDGETFERRLVQSGARDGDLTAIVAGLAPGERVVSKGAYLIRLSRSMSNPVGHHH